MYNIAVFFSLPVIQQRQGVYAKYFLYYSMDFVIHFKAIILAFPYMVFSFRHIITYNINPVHFVGVNSLSLVGK